MIKITKEKEVNKGLLESALVIVIGNKIIKPKIQPITVSSSEPEIIYEYKGFQYSLYLSSTYLIDLEAGVEVIKRSAREYFKEVLYL